MAKKAEAYGVTVRLHKLIYTFLEDLENLAHDAHLKDLEARGEAFEKRTLG